MLAASDTIEIRIKGKGGHAAKPHQCVDPIVVGAHIVTALQSIVSRNVDPLDAAVISIGILQSGSAANQIPGSAEMRGTMRTLKLSVRDLMETEIARICDGLGRAFGARIEPEFMRGNPVTTNTPAERDMAADAVSTAGIPLRRDMAPAMTGEDFAWYLDHRPGAFVWIGNGPGEGGCELHNSNYDFNDGILPNAAGFLAGVAKRALGG